MVLPMRDPEPSRLVWDSTASNWTTVRDAWQPWIAPLRRFLVGDDELSAAAAANGLCWNERDDTCKQQRRQHILSRLSTVHHFVVG